jgi:predicted aldo/keto reductase-like oxidoreductase
VSAALRRSNGPSGSRRQGGSRLSTTHKLRDAGVLEWAHERIREGRIGYLGFSFHDSNAVFREIIDACQN